MSTTSTESNLVRHARDELTRAGLFDSDSDYDGMLGTAVMELVEKFADQGHSGASAYMVIDLTRRLLSFEPLTPLTSDPAEWEHIAESMAGQPDLWQSRRRPDAFSNDGGRTYKITGSDEVHTSA